MTRRSLFATLAGIFAARKLKALPLIELIAPEPLPPLPPAKIIRYWEIFTNHGTYRFKPEDGQRTISLSSPNVTFTPNMSWHGQIPVFYFHPEDRPGFKLYDLP